MSWTINQIIRLPFLDQFVDPIKLKSNARTSRWRFTIQDRKLIWKDSFDAFKALVLLTEDDLNPKINKKRITLEFKRTLTKDQKAFLNKIFFVNKENLENRDSRLRNIRSFARPS